MEEKKKQPNWQIKTQTGLQVLLVSDSVFFGSYLCRKLLKKGAAVYYFNQDPGNGRSLQSLKIFPHFHLLKDELPTAFDYAFQIGNEPLANQKISPLQTLKLCAEVHAKFLFATENPAVYPRPFFTSLTKTQKVDWRLIYFHFVYGPGAEKNTLLNLFFSQIRHEKLLLAGRPQTKLYPLYIDDWVEGLLRAMFSQESSDKTYYLTGIEKIEMADLLLRAKRILAKNLEVVYLDKVKLVKTWEVDSWLLEKIKKSWWRLVYQPQVGLDAGIKKTTEAILSKKEGWNLGWLWFLNKFKKPKLILKFKFKISFGKMFIGGLLTALLLLFISSPLWLFAASSFLGVREFQKIPFSLKNNEWQNISKETEKTQGYFLFSRKIFWQFNPLFSLVLGEKNRDLEELLALAVDLSEVLKSSQRIFQNSQTLNEIVFQNKIADPKAEVESLLIDLNEIESQLTFSQLRLEQVKKADPRLLRNFQSEMQNLSTQIPEWRQKILFTRKILSLLPELLAFDGKKSYLVLFQNNMELRPTGGFIGSYAIVTFEKGRLLDFHVEDVYNADGQLKGYVEPPAAIKKYLGKESWYLRDANWSPDFPVSAQQTAWFLEKETGQAVDGVVAVNLNLVKSMLEVVGPVLLPEYQEKITSENLFERAEYHSEINFFAGSTQKKSFLTSLASFLFEKIKNLEPEKSLTLAGQWQKNLTNKDVMFYFKEGNFQERLRLLGWTGEIKNLAFSKGSQFQGPGIIDYLMLVDANLGVNKANYFLKRTLDYEVTILKEGQLVGEVTITYTNDSPSEAWPGGTYKNYLRVYLPADVQKITVKIQGQNQPDFKPLVKESLERGQEFGKSVFGFLVEVPAKEMKIIKITFQREEKLPLAANHLDYIFFCQKQSGTGKDEMTVKINYPSFLKPIKIMPQNTSETQKVSFKSELDQDKLFAVEFSR